MVFFSFLVFFFFGVAGCREARGEREEVF